jgi:beta-galactosidase
MILRTKKAKEAGRAKGNQEMKKCMMNKLIIGSLLATSLAGSLRGEVPDWCNQKVIQQGVETPHAAFVAYPSAEAALRFDRTESPWFQLLNGEWKFNWVAKPADRPADFYKPSYNDTKWGTIPVPSNWQRQGYGKPLYTNAIYPFPMDAPNVPVDDNPVGSYRHWFELADGIKAHMDYYNQKTHHTTEQKPNDRYEKKPVKQAA